MPLDSESNYFDLVKHNLRAFIKEGKIDDPKFISETAGAGKQLEIMTLILNDEEYLPAILAVVSLIIASSSQLYSHLFTEMLKTRVKLMIGKSMGSDIVIND